MSMFFLGGARNVGSFRKNVKKGRLPPKSSITYEGLFSTYFFPTEKSTDKLLEPVYSVAQAPNVMTGDVEKWINVSLISKLDGINERDDLSLIIVLDISGSMGSQMDSPSFSSEYSYDPSRKTIMDVAKEVLVELVKNLKETENIGIVLFDNEVDILQPLSLMKNVNKEKLIAEIGKLHPRGGTNMEIGFKAALKMFDDANEKVEEKKSRIIFLTDAHPNIGGGENSLIGLSKKAANNNIFTTFIGMGLDFNSDLVDAITKVKGSNYYSVNSEKEFKKILNEEFNFIMNPVCFNCVLFFESEGLEIEKSYGTPYQEESTSTLTKIDTVTPSPKDERGVQGCIILLKIKEKLTPKLDPSKIVKLTVRYETIDGNKIQNTFSFDFEKKMNEVLEKKKIFEDDGIRKAILLCKYATLMRNTIDAANNQLNNKKSDGVTEGISKNGLTESMKEDLKNFKNFFQQEMKALGDLSLGKEMDAIDRILYIKKK